MSALLLTWAQGVALETRDDAHVIVYPLGEWKVAGFTPGMRAALTTLAAGTTEDALVDSVLAGGEDEDAAQAYGLVSRLGQRGWLARCVKEGDRPLATATPLSAACRFDERALDETVSYELSRFALLRRDGAAMVLECPTAHARIVFHDGTATALVATADRARTPAGWAAAAPWLTPEQTRTLLSLLVSAGMVAPCNEEGFTPEAAAVPLRQWEFHDLLFHTRTRTGRYPAPLGGTFRFKSADIPSLPALKAPMSETFVDLFKPDMESLKANDVPFTAVMERRTSIRVSAPTPITLAQLGEFLYRTARVTRELNSESGEYAFRPYPGGGGEYELELYITVSACEGLAPGLYHYAPASHRLYQLSVTTRGTETMLGYATMAGARETAPNLIITLAARFQRVSWKYESIAYAIILKDVGVLLQTMYLVATAMELAPCAIGAGDADAFARMIGTDYYTETSVGEFLLGSRPANAQRGGAELADTARAAGTSG